MKELPVTLALAAVLLGVTLSLPVAADRGGVGSARLQLVEATVQELQKALQTKLGINNPGSTFDGPTEAAVRQFQRDNGLVPDGIAGPRTLSTLNP